MNPAKREKLTLFSISFKNKYSSFELFMLIPLMIQLVGVISWYVKYHPSSPEGLLQIESKLVPIILLPKLDKSHGSTSEIENGEERVREREREGER